MGKFNFWETARILTRLMKLFPETSDFHGYEILNRFLSPSRDSINRICLNPHYFSHVLAVAFLSSSTLRFSVIPYISFCSDMKIRFRGIQFLPQNPLLIFLGFWVRKSSSVGFSNSVNFNSAFTCSSLIFRLSKISSLRLEYIIVTISESDQKYGGFLNSSAFSTIPQNRFNFPKEMSF